MPRCRVRIAAIHTRRSMFQMKPEAADFFAIQHPNYRYLGSVDYRDGDLRVSHSNLRDAHLDRYEGGITLPS